ncbi:MAG: ABC transporter ATP-binding protein [Oscillospiraceae bacterium]|nr:ABC transporter ATP-binding protein [Oscillospiraceae bacterium]
MLELKNISAGYGNRNILEDVTATFEKGKLTSIIGVNGCGKSTLLKAILGILPITQGSITIDGEELSSLNRNGIAQRAAYLAQGKNTPDMTVMQMVLHGRFPYLSYPRRYSRRDRNIAYAAMEKAGVAHLSELPMNSLSGGMRQNAYIAMALAQDTDYILLDEPTAYLDISHQRTLMKTLRELAGEGKGVVAVLHDLPMAFDFSDELAVLHGGRIALRDTPQRVSASCEIEDIFGVKIRYLESERKYIYTV